MNKRCLLALTTLAGLLSPLAHAIDIGDTFTIEGFGTVGGYKSDDPDVKFRADSRQEMGNTGEWRFDGDTLFAAQATLNAHGPVKGVVQMLSHKIRTQNWRPLTEWAYIAWDITPFVSWKVGRVIAPIFLMSDTRNLAYAQTSVRPPQSLYQINPITNLDGTTVAWDHKAAGIDFNLSAMFGRTAVSTSAASFKIPKIWGGAIKANKGHWTARAGYSCFELETTLSSANAALLTGLRASEGPGYSNFATVIDRSTPLAFTGKLMTLALHYDDGNYSVQTEAVKRLSPSLVTPDIKGWYIQGAKRFGDWTPYMRLGQLRLIEGNPGFAGTGSGPSPDVIAATATLLNESRIFGKSNRDEKGIGVRWDFASKLALKAQYDWYSIKAPRYGKNATVSYDIPNTAFDGHVNVLTINLDYIF